MMEQIRTQIIFGVGTVKRVGEVVAGFGGRAMLVGGVAETSIVLREKIGDALLNCGIDLRFDNKADVIVAIGGGSVMDAVKIVAIRAMNIGWTVYSNGPKPEKALPIIAVPTMAASGSETNAGFVFIGDDGKKRGSSAWAAIPKVAILDPELTLSVPKDLTSYGLIDAYSHVLEGYLHGEKKSPIADAMAEAVMERIATVAETLFDNPTDLEARGDAMLLSNVANDGSLNVGRGKVEWKIHERAHQMADIYHGKAVAISMLEYFREKDAELREGMLKWFTRIGVNPMA